MGNKDLETTPWSDCPIDIFSLGETGRTFDFNYASFRRSFTEKANTIIRC
jgi:hypothetical protein